MIEFLSPIGPVIKAMIAFTMLSLRYFMIAGLAYLFFYVIRNRQWFYRKIQQKFPGRKKIRHEIKYSLLTFIIFSSMIVILGYFFNLGYTTVYTDISEHGIVYLFLTIAGGIFLHDAYFYWVHRFMHIPLIFKYVHKVHHQSQNPTPWAAFSFHPIEAILEFAIAPIILFTIPVHPIALLSFSL